MSASLRIHDAYTVALVCALPLEAAAAETMLDNKHPELSKSDGDYNSYTLGDISGHDVVIVCLPSGVYGTVSAATVTAQMRSTFHYIRFGLMVGIGGGAPSVSQDIRLGDIVVSKPTGTFGGVIQYDFGKAVNDGKFQQTGTMNQPPQVLLNAIARLQRDEILGDSIGISKMCSNILSNTSATMKKIYSKPALEHDVLFDAAYDHPEGNETCTNCKEDHIIQRDIRASDEPRIHYGLIASGNQVIKDGKKRDRFAKEYGILCFEMEAAGLMNQLPCLVIRGICDYSDSHKKKEWQGYAALAAAAYAKILLGVVSVSRDTSLPAPPTSSWTVPFDRNPGFVGRQEQVSCLVDAILSRRGTRKMALSGLGGVGKTQIALEVAFQVRDRNSDYSIFWIASTSAEAAQQGFMSVSKSCGLPDVTSTDVKSQVKDYLNSQKSHPWLLIFDNADEMDMWIGTGDSSSPALKSFVPQSENGFVLFTTRNHQLATKLVRTDVIRILEMDEGTARELLKTSLVCKELADDENTSLLLLRELSCLPLAILQAANYINETDVSFSTYLSILQNQEADMVELLSQDFEDDWRYAEIKNPVAVTWLVSFQHIRRLNSLATDYLSFMSCIDHRDIPLSILPPGESRVKQHNALGVLKAYSFIKGQNNDQSFSLHRLVHLATRNWLRESRSLEKWLVDAGTRLKEIFSGDPKENRIRWREYLPHALFILQNKESHKIPPVQRHTLNYIVGLYLFMDGRYSGASVLYNAVAVEGREELGPYHPLTLRGLKSATESFRLLGDWERAEVVGVLAVNTYKERFGPDNCDTLGRMTNLAGIYLRRRKYQEAMKLSIDIFVRSAAMFGYDHMVTLNYLVMLGDTCAKFGTRTPAAARLVEAATELIELSLEEIEYQHPHLPNLVDFLGNTYLQQGRPAEALKVFLQSLKLGQSTFGPSVYSTLHAREYLAVIYQKLSRFEEARKMATDALEISKVEFGPRHPHSLYTMLQLCDCLQSIHLHKEILSLLFTHFEIQTEVLGYNHPETIGSSHKLKMTLESYKNILLAVLHHREKPPPQGHTDMHYVRLGSHFYDDASREDIEFFKALFSLDSSRGDIIDAFNVLEGYRQSVLDLSASLPTTGRARPPTRADMDNALNALDIPLQALKHPRSIPLKSITPIYTSGSHPLLSQSLHGNALNVNDTDGMEGDDVSTLESLTSTLKSLILEKKKLPQAPKSYAI
ncbi:hypothetical protein EMPG_10685 [Blastomyces silverae]|uniref:Uncharacterized protein n=1 Tax=Blastomyces silverae TaxID=2060906 RepID=A0A0H1B388_9EURO|nr:hypothetical protein EMPG_10685 [Blastomyces silverae]